MSHQITPFEEIRRTNPAGKEFWSSRDFAKALENSQPDLRTGAPHKRHRKRHWSPGLRRSLGDPDGAKLKPQLRITSAWKAHAKFH